MQRWGSTTATSDRKATYIVEGESTTQGPKMEKNTEIGVLITYPISDYLLKALDSRHKLFKLWEVEGDFGGFVKEHGQSIEAVVCNTLVSAGSHLIKSLSCLELICTHSVGFDHLDLELCKDRNIRVSNTPDVLTDDVAELGIGLILLTLRRLPSADRFVRQGLWPQRGNFMLTSKLSQKTIGIVGLGRIGLAIAKRVEAFGCKILYHSRSKKVNVPYIYHPRIQDLARECDILVVACPLTNETRHVVDKGVLDALGKDAILVNIGRGALIDESELVKALLDGRLGGAGLDVYENEPNVPEKLFKLDNVVLLPHVGTRTWETRKEMADLVLDNLDAYFSKQPLLTPVEF